MASDERGSFEDCKVDAWLDNQPTRPSTAIKSPPKVSRKRKRDESDHIQADRPRKPLRETTTNSLPAKDIESDPPKRMRRGTKLPAQEREPQRVSPRKNAPSAQRVDGETDETEYSKALQLADTTLLPRRVLDVSDGFNLLPESLKDSIIAYCEDFETRIPRNEYFKKSSDPPRQPTQDELYTWEAVKRIRENATKCSEDGDSEAY
ncbi:hypothetical protein DL98DRAFT_597984 [Cadophora sp. DSE1049]|nr:hypothetical protein DL98DRAFT_597984 [Cadophora sp. DSE1049]